MKNVIYCRTTVPASKAPDGETPTEIMVTEEANLYCVWRWSFEGTELLGTYYGGSCRELALEDAVWRKGGANTCRVGVQISGIRFVHGWGSTWEEAFNLAEHRDDREFFGVPEE